MWISWCHYKKRYENSSDEWRVTEVATEGDVGLPRQQNFDVLSLHSLISSLALIRAIESSPFPALITQFRPSSEYRRRMVTYSVAEIRNNFLALKTSILPLRPRKVHSIWPIILELLIVFFEINPLKFWTPIKHISCLLSVVRCNEI